MQLQMFLLQTKIASCSSATRDWNQVQKSDSMFLEANKPYYIEAYHTDFGADHHVAIQVGLENTNHIHAKVGAARDEQQQITITSSLHWEIQVCPARRVTDPKRYKQYYCPLFLLGSIQA